jgi:hypothetical protein
LRAWETSTGKQRFILSDSDAEFSDIMFSPDGMLILAQRRGKPLEL